MNLIGLDISKVSTGLAIEVKGKNYLFSYNTMKITSKWNNVLNTIDDIKIRTYEYDNSIEDYSESEIDKLSNFSKISGDIIEDILSVIDIDDETILYLEGYSYGKNAGPLLDLVGIGSAVRTKIYENIPNIKEMKVIAPKALKLQCCEMVYGAEIKDIGKRKPKIVKIINNNENDVKGGDFQKIDMYNAIKTYGCSHLLEQLFIDKHDDISGVKTFPKPIEDLNDALLLKELIKFSPLEINI